MTEEELFGRLHAAAACGRPTALGVLGGTFDPVHEGHLALGMAALSELGLDGVLFVPAGNPAFKQGRDVAPALERLRMVELALQDCSDMAASACEVMRPGITYTVDTLIDLRAACPDGTRIVFVLGSDALVTLPLWHRARELAQLAEFAVAGRAGEEGEAGPLPSSVVEGGFIVHRLHARLPDVSSTHVRSLLSSRRRVDASLMCARVLDHIERQGLYGVRRDFGGEG